MIRPVFHLALHFAVPGLIARFRFPESWRRAWILMMVSLAVDLDHLLADPVFDPNRCSIGTHPLHHPLAITAYALLFAVPRLRLVAAGLLIHMGLDGIDCVWMNMI